MSSTVLQLIQQAAPEMGLATPSTAVGNTNQEVVQLLALINACGKELVNEFQWQTLTTEYRFTTVFYQYTGNTTIARVTVTGMSSIVSLDTNFMVSGVGVPTDTYVSDATGTSVVMTQAATETATGSTFTFAQTKYTLPTDYDRQVDVTDWDKTQHWELLGPATAQQWQWLKSGWIASSPRTYYRLLGGKFQIWPPQGENLYLGFEYISNYWVTATGGSAPSKVAFTVDTDTCIFSDRLMVLYLKKKFFEIKGFDTTAFDRDFRAELDNTKAADAGSPTLNQAPQIRSVLISLDNVPDSGFGDV